MAKIKLYDVTIVAEPPSSDEQPVRLTLRIAAWRVDRFRWFNDRTLTTAYLNDLEDATKDTPRHAEQVLKAFKPIRDRGYKFKVTVKLAGK